MKKQLFFLSLSFIGLSLAAQTPRLSLYEEFTGENCGPCAATNPGLNIKLNADTALIVPIKWQVPIPSAPSAIWSLYQTNKTEIDWRWKSTGYGYNPPINSAPSSKIDGQEATVFGAASSHPANLTHTVITTAQSYTSAFSITMNRAWNKTCTAINLTVTIQATAPFTSTGALVFRTVMVERLIQFSVAPGSNGESTFEDVAIRSFPTLQLGTSLPSTWTLGQTQTFTLNCPLPSYTRKKDQVAFVGFIQDDGNRTVKQAARANKAPVPPDALSGISANVNLTCTNVITPTVVIKNEGTVNAITALTLTPYVDGNAEAITLWTGNLAPGASTVVTLNPINSPALSGGHTFSCDIDMPSATYNLVKNNTRVTYMAGINYQNAPVAEGFTNTAYPPPGFGVINLDNGPSWSRSPVTGGYNTSSESSKYDFFDNTVIGDKDELYLPPMDLSGASNPKLFFDIAYAMRDASSTDMLDVMLSEDCGANWSDLYNAQGSTLISNSSYYTIPYVPDPSYPNNHWRTVILDLTGYNSPSTLIKFVATNGNGNNMYLDNIDLTFNVTGIKSYSGSHMSVALYPNPTNGITQIKMSAMKAGDARISVLNMLGQEMYSKSVTLNEGANNMQLDMSTYATGVYNVAIHTSSGVIMKKLTVTK